MIKTSFQPAPYTIPSLTVKLLEISAGFHEQTQLPAISIPKKFFGHLFSRIINTTLLPLTLIIDGIANFIFKPIIFVIESGICYIKGIINPVGARTRFRNFHLQERLPQKDRNLEVIKVLQSIKKENEEKLENATKEIDLRDDAMRERNEEFQYSIEQLKNELNYSKEQITTREYIIRLLENQKTKDLDDAMTQITAYENTIQLLEVELRKFDDVIAQIKNDNSKDIRNIALAFKLKKKEVQNKEMKLYFEKQEKIFDELLRKKNFLQQENDPIAINRQMLDMIYDLRETIFIQQLDIRNLNKWLNVYEDEIETANNICERQKRRIQDQRLDCKTIQKILTPQKPHAPKLSEKKYNSNSHSQINSSPYKSPSKNSTRKSPWKALSNGDQSASLRISSSREATPVNRKLKYEDTVMQIDFAEDVESGKLK